MKGITGERIYKALNEKNSLQRYVAKRLFPLLEPLGFHVVGDHFYEPIPNLRELEKNYPATGPRLLPHVAMNFHKAESEHVERLSRYGSEFREEVGKFGYTERNGYFPVADAVSLYCFLRERKPRRVIEVGQGFSTRVALAALTKNGGEDSGEVEFISVDPYSRLPATFGHLDRVDVEIVNRPIQSVDLEEFTDLLSGTAVLFVDSSHVLKPGSDVEYLMREVYPRVPTGTHVHIHDVYTPYPWPPEYYLKKKHFWNEQDHLESFLSFNESFRVELPLFWLLQVSVKVDEQLRKVLGTRDSGFGGSSFYVRRTR